MKKDTLIIKEHAKKLAEISALPEQEEKRKLWYNHNSLKGEKPLILIFPENSWNEILPSNMLKCEDATARKIEADLSRKLYYFEHLKDDAPIEGELSVRKVVNGTQSDWLPPGEWGVDIDREYNGTNEMYALKKSIETMEDLNELKTPILKYDKQLTQISYEKHKEYIGDILPVNIKGFSVITFHLMKMYSSYRGINQMYMDFYENPDFVHKFLEILTNGYLEMTNNALEQGLLELNNDSSYQSSGGKSYTNELPKDDYKGNIRLEDLWASAESQELSGVSPTMHKEFAINYEKRILKLFGLNGYGCCEPLHFLIDDILQVPNVRRISVSPFADYKIAAEKLGDRAIYSFKPNPAHLVGNFDKKTVYEYINDVVTVGKKNGFKIEIILKDTHTCENHPERFKQWLETAREAIDGIYN